MQHRYCLFAGLLITVLGFVVILLLVCTGGCGQGWRTIELPCLTSYDSPILADDFAIGFVMSGRLSAAG